MTREADLNRFYTLMDKLDQEVGLQWLWNCDGKMGWPQRGVYFFFEEGEMRPDRSLRVVRVGTHTGKKSKFWDRLGRHGADHWYSSFRGDLGRAIRRAGYAPHEEDDRGIGPQTAALLYVERVMPFLWVNLDGLETADNGDDARTYLERNAIGLLSNITGSPEGSSDSWLGRCHDDEKIAKSGLWNKNHVKERYLPAFLDLLAKAVENTKRLEPANRRSMRRSGAPPM